MAKSEVTCTSSFCCFFLQNKVSTLIFIVLVGYVPRLLFTISYLMHAHGIIIILLLNM